jgi:predicted amidohydrolase
MVVDPWGKVLLDMAGEDRGPEIGIVDVNLDYQEKIKSEMPLLRRTWVLGIVIAGKSANVDSDVYPEI